MENVESKVEKLREACKFHDWYYEYSDDYSQWSAGNKQRRIMNEAFRELSALDNGLAVDTWNDLAPKQYQYAKD